MPVGDLERDNHVFARVVAYHRGRKARTDHVGKPRKKDRNDANPYKGCGSLDFWWERGWWDVGHNRTPTMGPLPGTEKEAYLERVLNVQTERVAQ